MIEYNYNRCIGQTIVSPNDSFLYSNGDIVDLADVIEFNFPSWETCVFNFDESINIKAETACPDETLLNQIVVDYENYPNQTGTSLDSFLLTL